MKLPDKIFGVSTKGAYERFMAKHDDTSEKVPASPVPDRQTEGAQGAKIAHRDAVAYVCLILGSLCILSSILKTWLSDPNEFDWFVLAMGVVLCGITFFRRVAVGSRGFEAEMRELKQTVEALRMRT